MIRALAEPKKGEPPIDRPRDCDLITAADKLLVWAYGRPAPDRKASNSARSVFRFLLRSRNRIALVNAVSVIFAQYARLRAAVQIEAVAEDSSFGLNLSSP